MLSEYFSNFNNINRKNEKKKYSNIENCLEFALELPGSDWQSQGVWVASDGDFRPVDFSLCFIGFQLKLGLWWRRFFTAPRLSNATKDFKKIQLTASIFHLGEESRLCVTFHSIPFADFHSRQIVFYQFYRKKIISLT